jgi:hypothetical protein
MGGTGRYRLADRAWAPSPLRLALFECFPGDFDSNRVGVHGRFPYGSARRARLPGVSALFFFILLSILRLDARLCLFTGLVAAVEHFLFVYVITGALELEAQTAFWRTPAYNIIALSFSSWLALSPVWSPDKSSARSRSRCARFKNGIERFESSDNTSRLKSPKSCSINRSSSAANCVMSA